MWVCVSLSHVFAACEPGCGPRRSTLRALLRRAHHLDSESASEIMDCIRKATCNGTTVAMAIHAPGALTFAMFDWVIVLAQGSIIYAGETGGFSASVHTVYVACLCIRAYSVCCMSVHPCMFVCLFVCLFYFYTPA